MKNNAFQELSVSEVLTFVTLILLLRATNFVSERSCSTFKSQNLPAIVPFSCREKRGFFGKKPMILLYPILLSSIIA